MSTTRRWLLGLVGLALGVVLLGTAGLWRYQTTRPEYLLQQGQAALLRGDVDRAERSVLRLDAAGYTDHAHLLRGQTYLRQGQLARAILEYNQIRHDQQEVLAEASLIYGLGFLSLGRAVEAEKFLRYVADVRPGNVDAHRGLATIAYDRGAMTDALDHLKRWSELDERDGQPHRFMGLIYKDVAANAPAVEQYREALRRELAPRVREEVVVELAEVLIQQTEFADALACLDGCRFEVSGPPAVLPELRAECLYGLGRPGEAARVLDEARSPGVPSPRWLRVRAQVHADAGEMTAAAAFLEKALQIDAHDCPCRYQLALAYERLGRRTEAAEQRRLLEQSQRWFQELSDLSGEAMRKPLDAAVRRRLADVCTRLDKPELAQMWRRAAAACPPEGTAPSR
jgi:tetratricopeptide (TPR) repeat protein